MAGLSKANALFDEIRRLKVKGDVAQVLKKYAKSPQLDSNHSV